MNLFKTIFNNKLNGFLIVLSISLSIILSSLLFIKYNPQDTQGTVAGQSSKQLLAYPVKLAGAKEIKEVSQSIQPTAISDQSVLILTFDLHGLCLLNGKASSVNVLTQSNQTYSVSLSEYANNCYNGQQTVSIKLSDFSGLKTTEMITGIELSFWYPTEYNVDLISAVLYNPQDNTSILGKFTSRFHGRNATPTITPTTITLTPTLTSTPTLTPTFTVTPTATSSPTPTNTITVTPTNTPLPTFTSTPTPTNTITNTPVVTPTPTSASITQTSTGQDWAIQSVSSMKETKDKVCGQRSADFIGRWVDKAKELGANYVSVETPYDNPSCGDSLAYTKMWISAIRARGLHMWHRHMPLAFEGIYNVPKNINTTYLDLISNYIKTNTADFKEGDIFTPIPEPQNGGIAGITYCPNNLCFFKSAADFNNWLRNAIDTSETAFQSIGLGGKIKIGYYGFDGFVAWGDNNADWHGILEDATIAKMGNITIDHYPEIVNDTMENDLNELQTRYPNTPIMIGEWGTITGGDVENQVLTSMKAAKRPNIIGFNYWHMGVGGNEELVFDDLSQNIQYDEVQSFYKGLR